MTQLRGTVLTDSFAHALELIRAPEGAASRIAALTTEDEELSQALLEAARDPGPEHAGHADSPGEALSRLGTGTASRIALEVTLRHAFEGAARSLIDPERMIRHGITVGSIAEVLLDPGEEGDAYVAGLLHDVGRLAMAAEDPLRYSQVVLLARRGFDPSVAERRVFGFTHEFWGATLARQWALPEWLVTVIGAHHAPPEHAVGRAVDRAIRVASVLGIGDGMGWSDPRPPGGDPSSALLQLLRQSYVPAGTEHLGRRVRGTGSAPHWHAA